MTLRRDFAAVGLPVRSDVDVRPATIDDLVAITEIYNHYVVNSVATFDVAPFNAAGTARLVRPLLAGGSVPVAGGDPRGRVVGYATSSQFRAEAGATTRRSR